MLKRIAGEERFGCSLISKYPYAELEDVINETAEHQLSADEKVMRELFEEIEEEGLIKPLLDGIWQVLKSKYLGE